MQDNFDKESEKRKGDSGEKLKTLPEEEEEDKSE